MSDAATPPRFSVVIASYNYAHLLPRAVESALNQDFAGDWEVIVVDDGSTDNTREVIRPWVDRLHYHRKANAGHCAANNTGVELASGEWIHFLDADDELLPQALTRFDAAIREQPANVAMVSGGYVSVAEDGGTREHAGETLRGAEPARMFPRHVRKQLRGFKHGSVVIHQRVFRQLLYPEDLRNSTDIVFLGQVLARFPAGAFAEPVVRSHAHPGRVRRNTRVVVGAGLQPVDVLFDPAVMPAELMPLRREFLQRRLLSLFGVCYRAGDYRQALQLWWRTVRQGLPGAWRPRIVKRMLVSLVRLPRMSART
jgi:glycosyltransferase involved in cell wall biosynthesis